MSEYLSEITDIQARFARWIDVKMPYLAELFDFEGREYLPEVVESYLVTASHGETIMARFALAVWRHDNNFEFDITDAAAVLDPSQVQIISDWLAEPWWP